MRASRLVCVVTILLVCIRAVSPLEAQTVPGPEIWRAFAEQIEPGKTLKVRLASGERFKATLLTVSDEGLTVQPKTRVPVPPQVVRFADVASIEIHDGRGANLGKAVAVGAAVAAGAFFGLMALTFAVWGD